MAHGFLVYQALKKTVQAAPPSRVSRDDVQQFLNWLRNENDTTKGLFYAIILAHAEEEGQITEDCVYGTLLMGTTGFRVPIGTLPVSLQKILMIMPNYDYQLSYY